MFKNKENRNQTYKFKSNFIHRKTKQVLKYVGNLRKKPFFQKSKENKPPMYHPTHLKDNQSLALDPVHAKPNQPLKPNPVDVQGGELLKVQQPQKVCFKKDLMGVNQIYDMVSIKNVVEYEILHQYSQEYQYILLSFPFSMYVKKIEKIRNPFLKQSFELTREFHYNNVKPMTLFHGTKYKYLDDICTYNFDWRLSGLETGHRYGKGVNFTLDPEFAGNFCDVNDTKKIVIVADVLVIKDSTGHEDMDIPPPGYDTASRENRRTFVKFCDSEFLPKYVVTFDWNWYYPYFL